MRHGFVQKVICFLLKLALQIITNLAVCAYQTFGFLKPGSFVFFLCIMQISELKLRIAVDSFRFLGTLNSESKLFKSNVFEIATFVECLRPQEPDGGVWVTY